MADYSSSNGREMKNAYNILVRKGEGKNQFEEPRCRWEDTKINR
jgi:hypothetical protein